MHDFFYHGFLRMDWGLGNPNKTAALVAMLMIGVWGLAYLGRWGFWIAVAFFTALGICEIDTYSRGGVIATGVGLGILAWKLPRPWPVVRLMAVVACFWVIVGASIYLQASDRYRQGMFGGDQSITHRLELWEVAPRMMVDAPYGWGIGTAGSAYMQWYQPLDRKEKYRTLVNSHMTWLVELGWPLRFLYLAGIVSILILCGPAYKGWRAIPFCIWIAFLLAASFSSVAESPWLWMMPTAGLAAILGIRAAEYTWPRPRLWLIPIALSGACCLGLFAVGSRPSTPNIHKTAGQIIIGNGRPNAWMVVDTNIVGENFGRTIRRNLPNASSIGCVEKISQLPPLNGEMVVVCGRAKGDELSRLRSIVPECGRLVLLNPAFNPRQVPLAPSKTNILIGTLSQTENLDAWTAAFGRSVTPLAGVGEYVDNWPQFVFTQR